MTRLLILLVIGLPSIAQRGQVHFEHLSLEDGLSEVIVNTIAQDKKGYLWFGTQEGLNRYDGYQFRHYKHDPQDSASIGSNYIWCLFVDEKGDLWAGTVDSGLNHFSSATNTFKVYRNTPGNSEGLSHNFVSSMVDDGDGGLWIGTKGGGLNRRGKEGRFTHFRHDPKQIGSIASDQVSALYRSRSGTLWLGTEAGLNRYDEGRKRFDHFSSGGAEPLKDKVRDLFEDKLGHLWIATAGGLLEFEPSTASFIAYLHDPNQVGSISSNNVSAVYEDSAGRLWVGTADAGLNLFHREQGFFECYQSHSGDLGSLSHNQVSDLFEDKSGLLWVGTHNGLSKFNRRTEVFTWYRRDSSDPLTLGGSHAWAVYEDPRKDLWVGTGNGLSHFERHSKRNQKYDTVTHYRHQLNEPTSLSHNQVRDIYEDRTGAFWVATRGGGLNRLDRANGTFKHFRHSQDPTSLSDDKAWQIYEDRDRHLWVGTAGGGLNLYNRDKENFTTYRNIPGDNTSLSNDEVSSICETDRFLWVGTLGGLNRFDRGRNVFDRYQNHPDNANSLSNDRVLCIYESKPTSTLWVGTWGGLNRMEPNSLNFTSFREKDGMPSEVIYGILGDKEGLLWMSTNKGIVRFNPTTHKLVVFGLQDGLQSDEFNSGAYFQSPSGQMFFGGVDGLSSFYPDQIQKDQHPPDMVVTDFMLFNKSAKLKRDNPNSPLEVPIDETQELVLNYKDYVFSFEFAALHYAAPEKNKYAYQLVGLNSEWIYTDSSRRNATYTTLKHGNYRFKVKGSNKDGVWNKKALTIDLVVLPPPWQTAWAKLAYTAIALLTIAALFYSWRRKLRYEREVRETIRQSEQRLKFALWGSGDEHWDWDLAKGTIYRSNQSGLLALPEGHTQGNVEALRSMVNPKDFDRFKQAWDDHIEGRTPYYEASYRVRGVRKEWVWVLDRGKVVGRDEHGEPIRVSGTTKDISQLKETEDKLRLIAIAFENTSDGVFIADADFSLMAINQAYSHITGREPEEVLGKPFQITQLETQDESFTQQVMHLLQEEGQWHGELLEQHKNGEIYQQELLLDLVSDPDGDICYYVGVLSDITFRKKAEEELRHLANYDTLTNLPNRTLFNEHLEQCTNEAVRSDRNFAVLFIDLDNFKNINDSLGHSIGDLLLVEVGKRLAECVRAEDVVARFGGDEFSVLLKEVHLAHGAGKVSEKILGTLASPFDLEGHTIVISPSIGVVLYPSDGEKPEDLLRNADTAMYFAKSRGKNNYQFFTAEMNKRVLQRLQMESDLRSAIDQDELVLYYQPKVSFMTGSIVGMEALVRWHSPKHGFVNPERFLSVAEETGLIVPIGKLIFKKACLATHHWIEEGLLAGRMAMNLSELQFRQKGLLNFITNTLEETGLSPDHLEFEIKESTLMVNTDYAVELMGQFRHQGITLAIDDFGTGFSSLSYLRQFPVTSLKVDRSFVIAMTKQKDDLTIVTSIVGLAHNLGLKVVTLGVEEYEQVSKLREMGCEEMQGFFFSKPLPPEEFEKLLRTRANLYDQD